MSKGSVLTGLGLFLYLVFYFLTDFALHRASWTGGHAVAHLRSILPGAVWSTFFFFAVRLGIKLRREARS